jgi:hypothetical protein
MAGEARTGQGAQAEENCEYVRRLLRHKQPGASAALELAVLLILRELPDPVPAAEIAADASPSANRS